MGNVRVYLLVPNFKFIYSSTDKQKSTTPRHKGYTLFATYSKDMDPRCSALQAINNESGRRGQESTTNLQLSTRAQIHYKDPLLASANKENEPVHTQYSIPGAKNRLPGQGTKSPTIDQESALRNHRTTNSDTPNDRTENTTGIASPLTAQGEVVRTTKLPNAITNREPEIPTPKHEDSAYWGQSDESIEQQGSIAEQGPEPPTPSQGTIELLRDIMASKSTADTNRGTKRHEDKLYCLGIDIEDERDQAKIIDELIKEGKRNRLWVPVGRDKLFSTKESTPVPSQENAALIAEKLALTYNGGNVNEATLRNMIIRKLFLTPEVEKGEKGVYHTFDVHEARSSFAGYGPGGGSESEYVYVRSRPGFEAGKQTALPGMGENIFPQPDESVSHFPNEKDLRGVTDVVRAMTTGVFGETEFHLQSLQGTFHQGRCFCPFIFFEYKRNHDDSNREEAKHQALTQQYIALVEGRKLQAGHAREDGGLLDTGYDFNFGITICGTMVEIFLMTASRTVYNRGEEQTEGLRYLFRKVSTFDIKAKNDVERLIPYMDKIQYLHLQVAKCHLLLMKKIQDGDLQCPTTQELTTPKPKARRTKIAIASNPLDLRYRDDPELHDTPSETSSRESMLIEGPATPSPAARLEKLKPGDREGTSGVDTVSERRGRNGYGLRQLKSRVARSPALNRIKEVVLAVRKKN
jgi:hypothetical protein